MWQVVGECYVHGLGDAVSFLGPLPQGWKGEIDWDSNGLQSHRYRNSSNGIVSRHDPRLDPISSEWEQLHDERTSDDPEIFERYRNTITGETINSDPRLFPDELKARGVSLKTFQLV